MNEAENQNKPVEEEALFNMEDIKDVEPEDESIEIVEDTTKPKTDEVGTPTETEVKDVDYSPLLSELSKNIKYMDKEITVTDIKDVITNYQKGLDYDRKIEKINEIENSEETIYLKEKAKEAGMTTKEYIQALKDYEIKQEKQQDEAKFEEMVNNGVSETIAREVIETGKARKEFEKKQKQLEEKEKLIAEKERKDTEDAIFLQTYPDVDVKAIPKEVFKEAEKSNLLTAYTKYQNDELKKELELLKQNNKNKESSPIKGTTEHGGVVVEQKDDFLRGFEI